MAEPLDTDVMLETPEHIVFRYRVAGPARRLFAQVLDLALCYGALVAVAVAAVVGGMSSGLVSEAAKASTGLVFLLVFFAQWAYFVVWEAWKGRSPGKMVLGLAVVTTEGRPIGFREAVLRNVLRAADMLPAAYLVGGTAALFSPRFQRLGDLAAGTMVVVPERAARAFAVRIHPPPYPQELALLPAHVSLDPEERNAIELFLRRLPRVGPQRGAELAAMIAPAMMARMGVRGLDAVRFLGAVHERAAGASPSHAPVSRRGR